MEDIHIIIAREMTFSSYKTRNDKGFSHHDALKVCRLITVQDIIHVWKLIYNF